MKKLALLFVLLVPSLASAGEIFFYAGGAESLYSGSVSCTATLNASSDTAEGGIGDHSFITRDCPDSVTRGMVWHFNYPPDAATTGTPFTPYIEWLGAVGSGNVRWSIAIGCRTNGQNWDDIAYGTATEFNSGTPNSTTALKITQGGSIAAGGSTTNNVLCALRVLRLGGDGNDTVSPTASARVVGVRLNYTN